MSRHRGAQTTRRCELLGVINLLSPGVAFYPLSDGNPRYTTGCNKSYFRTCSPRHSPVKLPSAFALFEWFPTILRNLERLRYPFGGDCPSQAPPVRHCPQPGHGCRFRKPSTVRVVSQVSSTDNWRHHFPSFPLSCTDSTESQYQTG